MFECLPHIGHRPSGLDVELGIPHSVAGEVAQRVEQSVLGLKRSRVISDIGEHEERHLGEPFHLKGVAGMDR